MKLDVNSLRYLSKEEWRVLGSVELGQRNVRLAHVFLRHRIDARCTPLSFHDAAARNGAQGADRYHSEPKVGHNASSRNASCSCGKFLICRP